MDKCELCNHQIEYEICISCKSYTVRYCSGFCPMDEEPNDFDYYDDSGRIQCCRCAIKILREAQWNKSKEKNAPEK